MDTMKPDQYLHLQQQVTAVLSPASAGPGRFTDQDKARTYWEVGRMLNEHVGGRAAYGEQIVKRLAGDLGMDKGVVYRMMRFNRRLPKVASWPLLPWSHCRLLIAVPDQDRMESLLAAAMQGQWSVRQLQARIREVMPSGSRRAEVSESDPHQAPAMPLIERRGRLHTYRLVASGGELGLDLGFGVRQRIESLGLKGKQEKKVETLFAAGSAVEATVGGSGRAKIRKATVGRERLYTYEVQFLRMAGADTVLAEVDLGFGVGLVQRLRLRGINVGDLPSTRTRVLEDLAGRVLSGTGAVVAKTFRPDPRGQYLADFFYLVGEGDPQRVADTGRFLNGELLEEPASDPADLGPTT